MPVEVFAEIACPFTHAGLRRLVAERARRGAGGPRLVARAWPLELVNGAPLDPEHVQQEIIGLREEVAPELFGGFLAARFPATSIPAFGLAAAAYDRGSETGEAVTLAIRNALFEEGLDVADGSVLGAIGARFGVEPPSPHVAQAAVERDLAEGRRRGVRGSPHFFTGDREWFCPTLDIRRDGEEFRVRVDQAAVPAFYDAVFDGR